MSSLTSFLKNPVRLTAYVFLIVIAVLFAALFVVVRGGLSSQLQNREALRRKDVEKIGRYIEYFKRSTLSVPPISPKLQQIGTATDGCKMSTSHCTIENDACINMNNVTGNSLVSLPSDISIGSYYKSGYAVSYDPIEEKVTIVACGAETDQPITHVRSLKDITKLATPSADYVRN